jgi:hypothetical protein
MLSLPHTEFDMGNMAGVLQEAETAYSSGAPESTPCFFDGVHAAHMFLVLSVVCIVRHVAHVKFSLRKGQHQRVSYARQILTGRIMVYKCMSVRRKHVASYFENAWCDLIQTSHSSLL